MEHDDRLVERELGRLRDEWRVAGEPPLDPMWSAIEARAFPVGVRRQDTPVAPFPRWLALAAMLVLGFGLGQVVPRLAEPGRPAGADPALAVDAGRPDADPRATPDAPFVGIASGYLEQVTALLVTLANETEQGGALDYSRGQARSLLATTRMLLDAPGAVDPTVAGLLDDLELVLAQIAQLPNRPGGPDVYLIDQALDQRDVLPRLRVMLASAHDTRPY